MSKTITVSDEEYIKIKRMKESGSHQSESISKDKIRKKNEKLISFFGTWKEDPEEEKRVKKMLKEGWKKWSKRYASTQT